MYTLADPCFAFIGYHNVVLFNSTSTMLLLAFSIAFCIAIGTSLALPLPKPTLPLPSPTTVSAVNPKILPPLTTLATLLT